MNAREQRPIEVRLPDVDLAHKLDLIGAMIEAVREAHRDEMSTASWAQLHRAQEAIAAAMLAPKRNERNRLIACRDCWNCAGSVEIEPRSFTEQCPHCGVFDPHGGPPEKRQ